MNRSFAGAAALAALLCGPACTRLSFRAGQTIEEAPHLASLVRMGDPETESQLAAGFYGVESGAWRWTMKKFSVWLRPPNRSPQNGAMIELHFTLPGANLAKMGAVTLSASVGGAALPPEKYTAAGENTYRREVPAAALSGQMVQVDFALDKVVPPGDTDQRELGVIASSVGLVSK